MNNAVNRKAMENLRNKTNLRLLVRKKKRLFKMDIKTKLHVANNI